MDGPNPSTITLGMYGLQLIGMGPGAEDVLGRADPGWPAMRVEQYLTQAPDRATILTADGMSLPLGDGVSCAVLRRNPLSTTIMAPVVHDARALAHPFLAFPSAAANRWLGRDAFHAGAVIIDGGAWVISGDKDQGKSTLLAMLAGRGLSVLSDDIAVIDGGQVHRGPRCLDLRQGAADHLAIGEDIGVVGARRRWRHLLPPAPLSAPLRGFVFLSWDDHITVTSVPVMERLPLLFANQAIWRQPPEPTRFLGLAGLPSVRLSRPRTWDVADRVLDTLLAACLSYHAT